MNFAFLVLLAGLNVFDNRASAQTNAADDQLYYRRTHQGQWPPAGIDSSDHSAETTNTVKASAILAPAAKSYGLLYNNVDPANLGKGDWIWQMNTTESHFGFTTVQQVIDYEKGLGMQWITVKCGDANSIYSQFSSDLITRAHAAGLKIFGWAYVYGNSTRVYGSGSTEAANINGEINVALNALALGADGLIIDAEIEYETNATRRADATLYCTAIKSNFPNRFLAHAPFPYIASHSGFPYLEFGTNCDAVMPQDYWGAIGISPTTMVVNMNSQWRTWQNGLTGFNTNAIKPIIPLAQSYAPVTGAEITSFVNCLQTNIPKATSAGYFGISFWDAQERTADMDAAVKAVFSTVYFTSQPLLNRVYDAGSNITFSAAAGGVTPLAFQWNFNGAAIAKATNAALTLTNAQAASSGNYTVTVTNASGSVTSSPVSLVIYPPQATVFADTFETNSAASWTVNKSSTDTAIAFNFDYSTLGIPSAPHSTGGTTRGVQLKANLTQTVVAALSISPANQSFSGDYRLHFDGWINVNGPFPAGGASSTEFLTAGIGTAGNRTEWTGAGSIADGFYFSADGDGGVSATSTTSGDYCAYSGTTLAGTSSGVYAAGTDTTVRDNANAYYISAFPNGAAAPALQQSNYAQQSGTLNSGAIGLGWHDILVSRRGSTVDWAIDGFRLATISNATFTANNVFVGFWDNFSSLTDNTNLSFGLVDNVRVEVPATAPVISLQPSNVAVKIAGNATFTVSTGGLPSPNYQWLFNGTPIGGATNASYTRLNVQTNVAGNYAVVITNMVGSITSSNARLSILPASPAQFQLATELPDQTVRLTGSGDVAGIYVIETSTNLTTWTPVTSLVATNGTFIYNTSPVAGDAQRYFRARSGP